MSISTEIWKDVKYFQVFIFLNVPLKMKNILWAFQKDLYTKMGWKRMWYKEYAIENRSNKR